MVGPQDLLLGLVLAVFFFAAKKLPEIANSLGRGIKEFQKGLTGTPDSPTESNSAGAHHPRFRPVRPARRRCSRAGAIVLTVAQRPPRRRASRSPEPRALAAVLAYCASDSSRRFLMVD